MSFKQAATKIVREALDGQIDFLVLRGLDDRAREDGDIDVLVPSGCSVQALLQVAERAVEAGWAVAGAVDIGYLTQICLMQRWGEDRDYRAVKIDFFNGMAWAASGADPLGQALFDGMYDRLSEAESIGLATLLQKVLYAGYLRDRDRKRIALACTPERIKAFVNATGLPLSDAELDRGRLSRLSKWRLRAASAGVGPVGMPGWGLRVIWRKLRFKLVRSTTSGFILLVTGADDIRRTAVTDRLRSLLERAGFPRPLAIPNNDTGRVSLAWHRFRGETVVMQSAFGVSTPTGAASQASVLHVRLPQRAASSSDDLEKVLTAVSQRILETLRTKVPS